MQSLLPLASNSMINVKSIQFFVASGTAENPILIRYGLYMLE